MSTPERDGYSKAAEALGMDAPKPRLRVVKPDERIERETNGVYRPAKLDDCVGQVRAQIKTKMWVTSANRRGIQPGHVLLSGGPGLGKTTIAKIFTSLMNEGRPESQHVALHCTMGTTVKSPKQMAKALGKIRKGDVLFIDECHQMGLAAEEMLGLAMEDGKISVAGNDSGTTDALEMDIPAFTLVGATTKPAHLSRPLKDRFGLAVSLEYYSDEELAEIIARAAEREKLDVTSEAAMAIARVGRQTPRKALGVLGMVSAYADTLKLDTVDLDAARGAFDVIGIDSMGLDERDRDYLSVVASWQGRRVGLSPVAARSGLDNKEISDDIEPYLLRAGILDTNGRGRCLTKFAYQHLYPEMPVPPLLGLS